MWPRLMNRWHWWPSHFESLRQCRRFRRLFRYRYNHQFGFVRSHIQLLDHDYRIIPPTMRRHPYTILRFLLHEYLSRFASRRWAFLSTQDYGSRREAHCHSLVKSIRFEALLSYSIQLINMLFPMPNDNSWSHVDHDVAT